VAPGVNLLPVQVLGADGAGSAVTVARGIVEAVDAGADVLNLSLGTGAPSRIIERAVDYATDRGVVLVAASGNAGSNRVDWPAADPDVIAVGAVDARLRTASYSNGGTGLDLVAPGGDLSRDANGDGYADGVLQETLAGRGFTFTFFEGTSMAAPHVAGAAALLVAQVGRDPDRVRALLTETARDLDAPGWDRNTGAGLLDAAAAVAVATGSSGGRGGTDSSDSTNDDQPQVVLSEVMPDPTAYDDSAAEYIEVWNTGTVSVALARLGLVDEAGAGGPLSGDGLLEPGEVAVVARDTTAAWPWDGVALDALYPSDLFLNNGREVLSLTVDGREVDAVSWSRAPRGAAAERQGDGWVLSEVPLAGTRDFGTPGTAPR
jgi:subtilisin family serine protease